MPENTDNRITIKVELELVAKLKNEQHRVWKATGKEPTYSSLLERAYSIYEEIAKRGQGETPRTPPLKQLDTSTKGGDSPSTKEIESLQREISALPAWQLRIIVATARKFSEERENGSFVDVSEIEGFDPSAPLTATQKAEIQRLSHNKTHTKRPKKATG